MTQKNKITTSSRNHHELEMEQINPQLVKENKI